MTVQLDDNQIVTAVLAGDTQAFELLVRRYHSGLRRLAVNRTGLLDEADDMVQETFIAAYKSLHTYKSAYSFRTWLWTIHINQCRRHGSRSKKRPMQMLSESEDGRPLLMGSDAPLPAARLEARERERCLRDLLEELPETRADAVRLRFFGELKYQEIADAMGCSLSAAKKWVREGLQAMSEAIRQPDSAPPLANGCETEK